MRKHPANPIGMIFFKARHIQDSMSRYLEARGLTIEQSYLRQNFFYDSLTRQGFPVREAVENGYSPSNSKIIHKYLVEKEGIPIQWNEVLHSVADLEELCGRFDDARDTVRRYSDEYFESCFNSNFIDAIFFVKNGRFKSGSSSTSVGVSFYCIDCDWTIEELACAYLHECVHNALFIEDMIRSVFSEQRFLSSKEARVVSPIRKTERNFDLAFHAACVGIHLAPFYRNLDMHEKYNSLHAALKQSSKDLQKVWKSQREIERNPLTENGEHILANLIYEIALLK